MRIAVAGVGACHVAQELAGAFQRTAAAVRILEVSPPVSWFTALHGTRDVIFHVSRRRALYGRYAFDRDTILLVEIILADYDEPVMTTIKPALDTLWQASGLERCFDHSLDRRWVP